MSPLRVPSLAPTILLSALRGPGCEPDSRTRWVPRNDDSESNEHTALAGTSRTQGSY